MTSQDIVETAAVGAYPSEGCYLRVMGADVAVVVAGHFGGDHLPGK